MIFSVRQVVRFANAEIVHEMPCVDREGVFTIKDEGQYGLWISGVLLTKPPIGEFGFRVVRRHTGEEIPLSSVFLRGKVNGLKTGRMELYSFHAEKGTYRILLYGEAGVRDQIGASVRNRMCQGSADHSLYSVQIRRHTSGFVLALSVFGVIFASAATLAGVIMPIVL